MVKVRVNKVLRDLYVLRLDDDEVKFFEGLWSIPEGITYNSYVLVTDEGSVVFDSWKGRYSELFVNYLRSVTDLRSIKYVVIHHMEPDHSGSLPKLLELVGRDALVIAHPMVKSMLNSFYGVRSVRFKGVKDMELLKVGDYSLRFIHTPWLHWPETMMSYIEELGTLISCDAFGSYSIPESVIDEGVDINDYLGFVRKYLVNIVGYYREFIGKAISKLESAGIKPKLIAPSHGLILRRHVNDVLSYYRRASNGDLLVKGKVAVIYSSMYGFIERVMNEVSSRLELMGFKVVKHVFTDSTHSPLSEVLSDVFDSELVLIGASAYEGGVFPIINYLLNLISRKVRVRRRVIAYVVYGWGVSDSVIKDLINSSGLELVKLVMSRGAGDQGVINELIESSIKVLREGRFS